MNKKLIKAVGAMIFLAGTALADPTPREQAETLAAELTAWNVANPYRYETFWLSIDSVATSSFGIYRYQQGTSTMNLVEASYDVSGNYNEINWYNLWNKQNLKELIVYNVDTTEKTTVDPTVENIGAFIPPFGLQDVYNFHGDKVSDVTITNNKVEISYTTTAQQEGFPAWTHVTVNTVPGGGKTVSEVKFEILGKVFNITRQLHIVGQQNVVVALPNLSSFQETAMSKPAFLADTLQ